MLAVTSTFDPLIACPPYSIATIRSEVGGKSTSARSSTIRDVLGSSVECCTRIGSSRVMVEPRRRCIRKYVLAAVSASVEGYYMGEHVVVLGNSMDDCGAPLW